MDVFQCIRTRRAIREFDAREIPRPVTTKILEAGRVSPSSKNSQPWHFIVIRKREALQKISMLTPTGAHIGKAPLAIAVFMENAKLAEIDGARAVQNMVLTAWSEGIGSCWEANFDEDQVKAILSVPKHMKLITVMPFGYPIEPRTSRRKVRKALAKIVHEERFGQTYNLS